MENMGFEDTEGKEIKHNNNEDHFETKRNDHLKEEKLHIYKNVLLISFSFLLLFTAYESMSKLQSSINSVANLGTWSNSAVYASLVLSTCFLPSIIIKWLKVKWTLVASVFTYSLYIAAQFYPAFYTLIPTAFILGLGAAPLWIAKCTYLTFIANKLAANERTDPEPIVVKFFGIFFFLFQCNSILGHSISTFVFSSSVSDNFTVSEEALSLCGSSFCPDQLVKEEETIVNETKNNNFEAAADKTNIYTLAGIYLGCSIVAAMILAIFVDPLSRFEEKETQQENKPQLSSLQLVAATYNQMKKKKQLLIIPLTFWSGIEQGFFGADFTAGFVTCAYGVHILGRVFIVYGVCDALASVGFGFVIKRTGRLPIFLLGAGINVSVLVTLWAWSPQGEDVYIIFILASLWGVADAIWQTQINALHGVLFPLDSEAAFSNYRLWESMGFLFAFISQACGVCLFPKLVLALVILTLGMAGYLILEASLSNFKLWK